MFALATKTFPPTSPSKAKFGLNSSRFAALHHAVDRWSPRTLPRSICAILQHEADAFRRGCASVSAALSRRKASPTMRCISVKALPKLAMSRSGMAGRALSMMRRQILPTSAAGMVGRDLKAAVSAWFATPLRRVGDRHAKRHSSGNAMRQITGIVCFDGSACFCRRQPPSPPAQTRPCPRLTVQFCPSPPPAQTPKP